MATAAFTDHNGLRLQRFQSLLSLLLALPVLLATTRGVHACKRASTIFTKPRFRNSGHVMATSLKENRPAGIIYRIQAEGSIRAYHLLPLGLRNTEAEKILSEAVTINSTCGQISTRRRLDFEALNLTQEVISLAVWFLVVLEGDGPQARNETKAFMLILSDVNDNSPTFTTNTPHNLTIDKATPVGKEIGKVVATDLDHGQSGSVVYHLSEVSSTGRTGVFRINSTTGQVYLNNSLAPLNEQEYDLRVVARDKGDPPQETGRSVKVLVVHRDEIPRTSLSFASTTNRKRNNSLYITASSTVLRTTVLSSKSNPVNVTILVASAAGIVSLTIILTCCAVFIRRRFRKSQDLPTPSTSGPNNTEKPRTIPLQRASLTCTEQPDINKLPDIFETNDDNERTETRLSLRKWPEPYGFITNSIYSDTCSQYNDAQSTHTMLTTVSNVSASRAASISMLSLNQGQSRTASRLSKYSQSHHLMDIYQRGSFSYSPPHSCGQPTPSPRICKGVCGVHSSTSSTLT